jgi:putative ABC transport system substrate-binding protein
MGRAGRRAVCIAAAALLVGRAARAQPATTGAARRIGYISLALPDRALLDELRAGLRDAGHVEGRHVVIEARFAEGRAERLPDILAELIGTVDVLVVVSTQTAIAAKRATTRVPIVFASVFDPVAAGLVADLARPGGNVTGVAVGVGGGFGGKWVQLLKEAVPGMARAAVLWNAANPSSARSMEEIRAAARATNLRLDLLDAGHASALDRALAAIAADPPHGLIIAPDPFFGVHRARIIEFAARQRLPAIYFFRVYADEGGLMAYGVSSPASMRMAARYVDRILRGAAPGDLPIEQPTRFELSINLKTARALGLALPRSLLLQADRLIE